MTAKTMVPLPAALRPAPGAAYVKLGIQITARHPSHDLPDEQLRSIDDLTDLERVALYPFARLTDLQAYQEQMQGLNECMRRVILCYQEGMSGQDYLDAILITAGEQNDALHNFIEDAKAGRMPPTSPTP